tara:strand:- start:10752 stop:13925 length:3174 start_codon:yes stop_codon:yes gene_type:complete
MSLKQKKKTLNFKKRSSSEAASTKKSIPVSRRADNKDISLNLSDDMKNFLNGHLETEMIKNMDPSKHELEFRIGDYRQKRNKTDMIFNAYIERLKFNRMVKYYHKKYERKGMEENISLDIIYDQNFRVTVGGDNLNISKSQIEFFCKTNKLKNPKFMEKIQMAKSDNYDWNYRLTSSSESQITNSTQQLKLVQAVEDKTISKFYRYKYRYSYFLSPEVRVDFTVIKETPQGQKAGTLVSSRTLAQREKYQVELEYIGTNFNVENLESVLGPHMNDLIMLYNGSKGSKRAISKSYSNLILSRYLEMGLGELIPEQMIYDKPTTSKFLAVDVEALTRQNFNRIREDYMVTVKADGEHYLLYCDVEHGFFLINNRLNVAPIEITLPEGTEIVKSEFRQKIKDIGNCLFDGELVESDGKFRFLIFDCFFWNGRDLRDLPLYQKSKGKYLLNESSRIFYIKQFTKLIINDILKDNLIIEEKSYFLVSKVSRFFKRAPNGSDWIMDADLFPYEIDGLIFMPVNESYPIVVKRGNRIIKRNSMDDPENISPILKWKPPQFLSIDFKVNFKIGNGNENRNAGPVIQKINNKDHIVMELESSYGTKIHAFEPSAYRVKDYNKVYIPLTNGIPELVEQEGYRVDEDTLGHVIKSGDILEFVWSPDRSMGEDYWGRWVAIKYREDKTANGFPNGFRKVADRTWLAIHDKQVLPENLMDPYGQNYETPQLDLGYYQNVNRDISPHLRNIHNGIKSILLFLSIKQSGNRSRRLMDLATGRGGDFGKWAGINYAFGIEFDESNLKSGDSSAYARYRKLIEEANKNDRRPQFKMDLIQGDMRTLFEEGRVSDENVFNHILKDRLSRNTESFGIISCQFAMHYACDTEDHIDNFFKNVSRNLAPNGYFIATAFDGARVLNDLKNTTKTNDDGHPTLTGRGKDGKIMWSISSPGKYKKIENIGQKILVFNKTIKDEEEVEYLVNFSYLIEVARKYNLYPGQLSFGKYTLPLDGGYGVGGFEDAYDETFLKLVSETTYAKGSVRFRELENSYNKISTDMKRYSKYSSFFILRKQS